MSDRPAGPPLTSPYPPGRTETVSQELLPAWMAAAQVVLVSGVPTQILIVSALVFGAGVPMPTAGEISLQFFALVSLVDTVTIALLVRWFLAMNSERLRPTIVGSLPVRREMLRGLALLPPIYLVVVSTVVALRTFVPWMHTVERSPLEAFMRTPLEAGIFVVVVVLAGGIREELQRAFILHRFEQRLGGIWLGLVLFTIAFGAMHYEQGADVAVAVGIAGFFWGVLYIRRRSAVAAMTNHAAFNAAQVLQALLVRTLGG